MAKNDAECFQVSFQAWLSKRCRRNDHHHHCRHELRHYDDNDDDGDNGDDDENSNDDDKDDDDYDDEDVWESLLEVMCCHKEPCLRVVLALGRLFIILLFFILI